MSKDEIRNRIFKKKMIMMEEMFNPDLGHKGRIIPTYIGRSKKRTKEDLRKLQSQPQYRTSTEEQCKYKKTGHKVALSDGLAAVKGIH